MPRPHTFTVVLLALLAGPGVAQERKNYPLHPMTTADADVPRGEVTEHRFESTGVYPGTVRRYSVYVPSQYRRGTPAALMVFTDGHSFAGPGGKYRVPKVFDQLIAAGHLPVTVAVMVDPGNRGPLPDERGWNKGTNNRSREYDTVSDEYARFLIEELLPAAEAEAGVTLTDNPDLRGMGGDSSGGICSFGVAWHRPDSFRRVMSHIGSFVNINGGHNYEALVRKGDKRPLRMYQYECKDDLNNEHGNWPLANLELRSSLEFREYDLKFVMGDGVHVNNDSGKYFPDAIRWLWQGWEDHQL